MKWIKRCFHFLGGIQFAIMLIATVAGAVAIGTIMESYTDSHLFAAQWTYHHPFFALLLWLFFVNILFSAIRRWPFKARHLPFLLTHLGLLMIIGGTLIKNKKGIQGNLSLWEGSGNQTLILPQTYALLVEKKGKSSHPSLNQVYPLSLQGRQLYQAPPFSSLKIKVLGSLPHVSEKWETWIKGKRLHFFGAPSLPVKEWTVNTPFPEGMNKALSAGGPSWQIRAIHSPFIQEAIQETYLKHLVVRISSRQDPTKKIEVLLKEALAHPFFWNEGLLSFQLSLPFSPASGFDQPYLEVHSQTYDKTEEKARIALEGNQSLYVTTINTPSPVSSSFTVDLIRPQPSLLALEDNHQDIFLCAFDLHGRVQEKTFRQGHLETLFTYDHGFGGYTTQASFLHSTFPAGRQEKEQADLYFLGQELQKALASAATLAPPLAFFKKTCQRAGVNFVEALLNFLVEWDHSAQLLLSSPSPLLKQVLEQMNWADAPLQELEACQWICQLFQQLNDVYQKGEDLFTFLQAHQWPFLTDLQKMQEETDKDLLTLLAQQIFSITAHLPHQEWENSFSLNERARLLSAYFKAYDISYPSINPLPEKGVETFERLQVYWKEKGSLQSNNLTQTSVVLETPISISYHADNSQKLEENRPCLFLEVQEGSKKQLLSLAYDSSSFGLKWPLLNGEYLIRFQPQTIQLPYRIRLRQARQINYPNSQQPYSYEGDIFITGENQTVTEKTLSMNHVHETWDGYRFYLAGMNASSDQAAKRVQIVVNHDPAKYYLTYPGAIIVTLGALLLFWFRPYRKKNR